MKNTQMSCIICGESMQYYFSKKFTEFGLDNVDYFKCPKCGFVASATHFNMPSGKWEKLNIQAHTHYNTMEYDPKNRPPPYLEQALLLYTLRAFEVIPRDNWLDWGSGEAKLATILLRLFSLRVTCFDKYVQPLADFSEKELAAGAKYNVVINSAVFEHVTSREVLDEINSLVDNKGVLAVHTLVREEIPADKEWFYLLPVHCAFHTNKSMKILIKDWGYRSSLYCPLAKMWIFFRDDIDSISPSVKEINRLAGFEYLFIKNGFMDYWK